MADVIIIGAGPAGVSAALYTIRGGLETTVITSGESALEKAEKIENYYGFPEPISGKELLSRGIDGAERLGVKFVHKQTVSVEYEDDGFSAVTSDDKKYKGKAVLFATGSRRLAPPIRGITEFEGKGVSYCAVCDAFFYRNKDVGVLGSGEYALHEAKVLARTSKSVTVFTNGDEPQAEFPSEFKIVRTPVSEFGGDAKIEKAVLKDGSEIKIDGLFIAYGVASSAALAKKIGAITNGSKIKIDDSMMTNVKGIFAAGDCTGGLLQVSKAVGDGAAAGTEIIKYVRKEK
ncbi:MAG: FAD-dependent oxidoreductase [Ruminococcus sp.]|nr:FAD-dependent oxidoreductase [Ruminococcus sp.]MDY3895607.1 FAD-dependent oxidoreductase [Candidatus Fimenecus sp.]